MVLKKKPHHTFDEMAYFKRLETIKKSSHIIFLFIYSELYLEISSIYSFSYFSFGNRLRHVGISLQNSLLCLFHIIILSEEFFSLMFSFLKFPLGYLLSAACEKNMIFKTIMKRQTIPLNEMYTWFNL